MFMGWIVSINFAIGPGAAARHLPAPTSFGRHCLYRAVNNISWFIGPVSCFVVCIKPSADAVNHPICFLAFYSLLSRPTVVALKGGFRIYFENCFRGCGHGFCFIDPLFFILNSWRQEVLYCIANFECHDHCNVNIGYTFTLYKYCSLRFIITIRLPVRCKIDRIALIVSHRF